MNAIIFVSLIMLPGFAMAQYIDPSFTEFNNVDMNGVTEAPKGLPNDSSSGLGSCPLCKYGDRSFQYENTMYNASQGDNRLPNQPPASR